MNADLPEAIKSVIANIQICRLALLPPYAYDGDEGEKDAGDYLAFYKAVGVNASRSAEDYRAELLAAREAGGLNEMRLGVLDRKRREFIRCFPFSRDELEEMNEDELDPFMEQLGKIYEADLGSGFILTHLARYIEDCRQVIEFIEGSAPPVVPEPSDWRQLKWGNCQRALSEEEIRRVEEALDVRFPADYRDCVQHCHGGTPHPNMFWFDDPDIGNMGSSLGILLSFTPDDQENILDTYRRLSPFLPPSIIPFADDGGGDFMCFDFRRPGPPSVGYWHHGEENVVLLSDSFSGFLGLLSD